jgi:iron complex outermembrane receptor protein
MSNRVRASRARLALISGCAVCSTLGVLSSNEAAAQQAGGESAEGHATLEEVVVTSRRREESLQDVPISVSAFSAESIERNRIEGVDDVFSRTPNVSYTTEGSRDRKRLSIRGVTEFITEAGEATVPANTFGIYIDDFSVATATSNPGVMDIERIEVLRGPQGTYFGRNAVGGALNITTKKPNNEFFSEVTGDVSRYDTYEIDGTLNLPLIADELAMRANVKYQESDGYIKNINPTGGGNDSEYKYGRLSLRYTPNEQFTLDVIASASDELVGMREGVPSGVLSAFTESLYGTVTPDGIGYWPQNTDRVNFNRPQEVGSEYQYITARAEYRWDTVRLTSVSGYLESKTFLRGDVDGGSEDLFYEHKPYDRDALSQEFRLGSIEGQAWDWTVGAIYSRDRGNIDQATQVGNDQPFGLPVDFEVTRNTADNETIGAAVFGEAVWHATDRLDLLVGVRATRDKVKISEVTFTAGDARLTISDEDTFDDISPRFTASYALSDTSKVYATISKGFKSGGVQIAQNELISDSYDPETIWNYEVGIKSEFLDGRARLNAAAFLMEWSDLQASFAVADIDDEGTIVFTSGIQNAAEATNYGVEAELSLLPTDRLLMNVSVGYLHGEFDEFTNAFIDGAIVDLSHQVMPNAPQWTASADAQYTFPLGAAWEGFVRAEWFYRDDTYSDLTAVARRDEGFPFLVPSYDNTNLRAGVQSDRFSIVAYVENLFDEKYFTNAYEKAFVSGMALQPSYQTYGVRFTWRTQ